LTGAGRPPRALFGAGRGCGVALLFLLPLLVACELTEVTIPSGEPVVIVQSVLSRTRPTQFVIVEESLTGSGGGPTGDVVPPAEPRIPITGARVQMTHLASASCPLATVELDALADTSGLYTTDSLCPLEPGDRVRLRVEIPDGTVVTGETQIPGAESVSVRVGDDTARFEFQELVLDRERDTLRIGIEPILARAMQVEIRRADQQDELAFFWFTDTLGVALAGNLVNPFEGDSGETMFRAGRTYLMTVAVTDSNYFDFIRSRSDPFTGRGFINHLEGGMGVFGSVEARSWVLRVIAPIDDPREGTYRVQGRLQDVDIDLRLELFLDDLEPGGFSAFVEGAWLVGDVLRSADGTFDVARGRDDDFVMHFTVPVPGGLLYEYGLSGTRAAGGQPFDVTVTLLVQGEPREPPGTLTARQTSGPTITAAGPR